MRLVVITVFSIIVSFIVFRLFVGINECNYFEQKIKNTCKEKNYLYCICLDSLSNIGWSELYIISGPRFPNEVKPIIKLDYNRIIEDNSKKFIFIKNNKIVDEYSSFCRNINYYSNLTEGLGYVKFKFNERIFVRMKEIEGNKFYYVLQNNIY